MKLKKKSVFCRLEVSKKEIEMLKSKLLNNNRSNTPTISEVVRPLPNNDAPEPPPRTRGRHAEATALNKSSCDRQVEAGRASIPTAKVQPQPSPTAQVQPRSTPTPKQTDSVANRERPGSPAQRTDPSPVKVRPDQGQTRNQSRRSRKNRARRH